MDRISRPRFLFFDFWLLGATLLLTAIGIAMIYSATECITGEPLDWASPTVRQALYAGVGIAGMFIAAALDYRLYASLRWILWFGILALLVIVFFIGQVTLGAQRWIDLRVFLFQPSELCKLILILVTAKYMADHASEMTRWRHLAIAFIFAAIPMGLVYLQPDLGTTIVIGATWGVMALAAGMRLRDVLIVIAICVVFAPLLWTNLRPYQQERVLTFVDPGRDPLGSGYNVTQARIAIGSGGVWGAGFCGGPQSQLRFLRIRQTDFIFSVIGEELGFFGGVFVIALYGFILFRLIRVAMLARDQYSKLIAVGVVAVLFIQTFVNLGMNLGLMPVVGIPLPFVSSGGSSLITLFAAQGVAQSILLRHRELQLEGSGRKYQ
ncbi:MAG: rod shape-determining protein RodA [Chloroflexi bacterium]|nr:rod shape-determining protein RodA [Chloroflexota bacterium]